LNLRLGIIQRAEPPGRQVLKTEEALPSSRQPCPNSGYGGKASTE
jgi:hypothetical protein